MGQSVYAMCGCARKRVSKTDWHTAVFRQENEANISRHGWDRACSLVSINVGVDRDVGEEKMLVTLMTLLRMRSAT